MLSDKIVVITGGAGLLGRDLCKAILLNNGTPIIADLDEDRGESLLKDLNEVKSGGNVAYFKTDITSRSSLLSLVKFADQKFGKIHALVNNAYPRNKAYGKDFLNVSYEDFCENINMHLGGYFLSSQVFASYFVKQGYGNIVNIASIYGSIAPRFEIYRGTNMDMPVEYAAIKSSVIHLTRYMARYFKGKNVRVNAVSPGGVLDDQNPKFQKQYKDFSMNKGMLDPDQVSQVILFLLSENSSAINGQNLIADDGFTL